MGDMVHLRIHRLRSSQPVDPRIFSQHIGDLRLTCIVFYISPKLLFYPAGEELIRLIFVIRSPALKVISQLHKKGQWKLIRADIPYIGDPQIPYSIIIGHGYLLPYFGKRRRIDPLIGDGTAMIIKMII